MVKVKKKFVVTEILLILGILIIIGLFIVPVSPVVIDILILFNVVSTILLISLVIYVDSPGKLTFFPSMLLLLTIFRIGLSISTSRSILLNAQAGDFIEMAGKFLIGDNIVVGIIMFVIIAIVNFLVVTKGSERVAEVVARFTLDAMPGKQMSIDADLKAGNITIEEAQRKRQTLQTENSLYGSLDGATKFIKGDVISNIIIVLVNLIGGIVIAIYQKDYDLSQATSIYTILSIGDGLLQQIPITLSSLSGGIIVTRINDELGSGNIGQSVKSALIDNSVVLLMAALILPLLFIMPQAPKSIIGIFFLTLVITFIYLRIKSKVTTVGGDSQKIGDYSSINSESAPTSEDNADLDITKLPAIDPWKVYPIIIVLSNSLIKSKKNKVIIKILESVNSNIFLKLGIELPKVYITQGNIPENHYQILVNELPVAEGEIHDDYVLVPNNDIENLFDENEILKNNTNIGLIESGFWVPISQINKLESLNFQYLNVEKFLLEHVTFVLINNVGELIGFQEVKIMLDRMTEYQDLVRELLRMIPLNKVTEVIKRLLSEKISLRNFKFILDALLEWAPKEKETILLVEYVRVALGKYIGQMFKVEGKIYAIALDSDLENDILESIRYTNNGFYLDLVDTFYQEFNHRLAEIVSQVVMKNKLVVITNLNVRKAVSYIIGNKLNIAVLSYEEVSNSNIPYEIIDFIYL